MKVQGHPATKCPTYILQESGFAHFSIPEHSQITHLRSLIECHQFLVFLDILFVVIKLGT